MKFRKKPVVIEAIQFDGSYESFNDIVNTFGIRSNFINDRFTIKTLEGEMIVMKSDFVIKGVKDEFYPCKPDIFEITYEAIE